MHIARFCALGEDHFAIAQVRGNGNENTYTFSRIRTWKNGKWNTQIDYNLGIASIFACNLSGQDFCTLFETGEIALEHDGSTEIAIDVSSTDTHRKGYLLNGIQIGSCIIFVGDGGQTYCYDDVLKGLPFIEKLFTPKREKLPNLLEVGPEAFFAFTDKTGAVSYRALSGNSLSDLYLCGGYGNIQRTIIHWDGKEAREMLPPRPEGEFTYTLTDIQIDDATGDVWACGMRGALFRGNARDGFEEQPGIFADYPFYRLAIWQDAVWLAAGDDVYRYQNNQLFPVQPPQVGFGPGIHTVESCGNVLWVCSLDRIARYDGTTWETIDAPE